MIYAVIGFILGFILATMVLSSSLSEEEERIYYAEKRASEHFKNIETLEKINKEYQKDNEILLNNCAELRAKTVDLENNIEFLVNNLSNKNKELINHIQQND